MAPPAVWFPAKSCPALRARTPNRTSQGSGGSFDARCLLPPRAARRTLRIEPFPTDAGFTTFGRLAAPTWRNEAEPSSLSATAGALAFPNVNGPDRSSPLKGRFHDADPLIMVNTSWFTRTTQLCLALSKRREGRKGAPMWYVGAFLARGGRLAVHRAQRPDSKHEVRNSKQMRGPKTAKIQNGHLIGCHGGKPEQSIAAARSWATTPIWRADLHANPPSHDIRPGWSYGALSGGSTGRWPVGFGSPPKPEPQPRQKIKPLRVSATIGLRTEAIRWINPPTHVGGYRFSAA